MPEEKNADRFYTGLVVASLVLLGLTIRPFFEALLLAAVLAGALYPIQEWLAQRLKGRRGLSAALLSTAVVAVLLIPTVSIATVVIKQTVDGGRQVLKVLKDEGVEGAVEKLPEPVRGVTQGLLSRAPVAPDKLDEALREKATAQQGKAVQTVQRMLSRTGAFILDSAIMVVALFFLLIDGRKLVGWCERASPLKQGQTTELLSEFRKVSVSVIVSNTLTGLVQAAAALVGYLIAGVPKPWLFAVLTFFMSFIPAIGAGGTCFVAALFLVVMGKVGMAIFLAVWGAITVGLSDNVVKPLLAKKGMHMHGAIVFLAMVSGLAAFGAIGLLLGPLIVSFLLTLVRIRERNQERAIVVQT